MSVPAESRILRKEKEWCLGDKLAASLGPILSFLKGVRPLMKVTIRKVWDAGGWSYTIISAPRSEDNLQITKHRFRKVIPIE